MVMQQSTASSPENSHTPRPLNTPEFIDRLATELRSQGDVDLPHSYYVEQVKLRLAGEPATTTKHEPATHGSGANSSSDCFRSWALGE